MPKQYKITVEECNPSTDNRYNNRTIVAVETDCFNFNEFFRWLIEKNQVSPASTDAQEQK